MFGRRNSASDPEGSSPAGTPSDSSSASSPLNVRAQAPKGRPTPSRKEAEAHRKQALKVPADPKAAKKAMREREREERMAARAGLMAGDERHFPARDRGPAKAFTRDFVDRRRRLSEYFLFLAVGILLAGLVPSADAKAIVSLAWLVIAGLVVIDVAWMLFSFNRELKQQFPDKGDRRGCTFYCVMRSLQIRKLRVPPPRVRPGGNPVASRSK